MSKGDNSDFKELRIVSGKYQSKLGSVEKLPQTARQNEPSDRGAKTARSKRHRPSIVLSLNQISAKICIKFPPEKELELPAASPTSVTRQNLN